MEQLITNWVQNLAPFIETLLNEAMKIVRESALNAASYERSLDRTGYANGFKDREYASRLGPLKVRIPQARGIDFYPKCHEKGDRSERALKLAVAEMYIQGVSTRKVAEITEKLCGFDISSSQVSRCAKSLDEELQKFRERPLTGKYAYVYFDAEYEKVRHDHSVRMMINKVYRSVLSDLRGLFCGLSSLTPSISV